MSLSYEEITDLVTLMLTGADKDADMTLDRAKRFLDYWAYLSDGKAGFMALWMISENFSDLTRFVLR